MRFVSPVEPMLITSYFGPRPKPNGPVHPGLDFHATYGQAIHAVDDGEVVKSYFSANNPMTWRPGEPAPKVMGFGETILILHLDGRLTRYAHLSKRLVEAGEHVKQGQVIGQAGTTGYSFGVHLHFELRGDGGRSYYDPLPEFAYLNPPHV
jgi:murein DD-endopeptidase MepM/ murein hydrolase activator NlpD